MDEAERISSFWEWWDRYETTLSFMLDKGAGGAALRTFGPQLERRISEIDRRLRYRIRDGTGRGQRTLVITAQGDGLALAVARRVRDAAPAPTKRWAYTNLLPRLADLEEEAMQANGLPVRLRDMRLEVHDMARKVDLLIWHPLWPHFSEEERLSLGATIVAATLGEEIIECWVGDIQVADERPEETVSLAKLRDIVDDIRSRFVPLPGESPWTVVQGTRYDGAEVHARVQVPICAAREPLFEKVVTIRLHLEDPAGSPHADSLEGRIVEAIGFDGELVAVETVGTLRTWYCYVRPDTDAMQRLLDLAKSEELPAEAANDPTWEVVSHLS